MVLEGSEDECATGTPKLDFGPKSLEGTHQRTQCSGISHSLTTAMIMGSQRDQERAENNFVFVENIQSKNEYFHGNLSQNTSMAEENNNNNKYPDISHVFKGCPDDAKTSVSKIGESEVFFDTLSDDKFKRHQSNTFQTLNEFDLNTADPQYTDLKHAKSISGKDQGIAESFGCSSSVVDEKETFLMTRSSSLSSFSSSDEDECNSVFDKQIEQALKLGYSEKSVVKALCKIGHQCSLNDLLSELIKLGTSDLDSLLPEEDDALKSEDLRIKRPSADKYHLEPGEPSSISTFGESQEGRKSACVGGVRESDVSDGDNLCDIVIDGSNVAMSHGKNVFSCKGIQIAVDWFRARGHQNITVFVPQWRKETSHRDTPITDQDILCDLEKQRILVFTPSRRVKGRRVVCYDDRYILKLAVETSGIVVSNDVYRDLVNESEEFHNVVDQRLLMYSFVNDRFMPPEDPLGRLGPTLDDFLRKTPLEPIPRPQDCPYGKKCTYGNKCRFYHPKRGYGSQKSISDSLKEQAQVQSQERASRMAEITESGRKTKQKLSRTKSLIPVDSLPAAVSPVLSGEAMNMQSRPKYGHSKSLISPLKSSDYLNEPRRKLEEAELAAALEKAYAKQAASLPQTLQANECAILDSKKNSQSLDLDVSAPLVKDVFMENSSISDIQLINTSSLKSSSTSQMSTPHLILPKTGSHEGFLSGHLYLAKKLSDESSDGNFFSERASSASPTQSSRAAPCKTPEQRQTSKVDTSSQNSQDYINVRREITSQYLNSQRQLPAHTQQLDQYPEIINIPSLSIFEAGTLNSGPRCDSGILSPLDRFESSDSTNLAIPTSRNVDLLSPDSGRYSSMYASNPYQCQFENLHQNYPFSKADEELISHQHHYNLHKTYSSTDNIRVSQDPNQQYNRRLSALASFQYGENNLIPNSPYNLPTHIPTDPWQPGYPHGLRRQNSNSDPQLHNITSPINFQTTLPPNFTSGYSSKNFPDILSMQSQQSNNQFQHFEVQNQHTNHQQNKFEAQFKSLQYDPDSSALFPHLLSKQLTGSWGQIASHSNIDYKPPPGGATQNLFQPHQSPVPVHSTSNFPHFMTSTGSQNLATVNFRPYNIQPPPQYPQLPLPQPTLYTDAHQQSANNYPSFTSAHTPHTSTHPPHTGPYPPHTSAHPPQTGANTPHTSTYLPHTSTHPPQTSANTPHPSTYPSSTGYGFSSLSTYPQHNTQPQNKNNPVQPSGKSTGFNEDALIQPDDPCYQIYYHLSNVFGEPIVRKVLNRNPGVLNPDQICKLIMEFKEGRGS